MEKITEKFPEKDELKTLLAELQRRSNTYRIGLLAERMSLNGGRIGELTSLNLDNINYESQKLRLHGTLDHTQGYRRSKKALLKQ